MKNKLNKKAFTLVELLVVIAIISILFVVLISKVDFATDKAKTSGVQTDFRSFQMALHTVASEQQGFTSDLDELAVQLNRNLDKKLHVNVNGSEMESSAKDTWGTNYKLTYAEPDNARGEVTVHSAGPDMQFHTDDDLKIAVKYALTENGADIIITGNTGAGQDYNQVGTPAPIVYEMLEGDGLIVTAADEAVFRSAAEISNFKNVKIGNTVLTENVDFVKTEGSTVITLTENYVRSLENGEYTITIAANDGYARAMFKVEFQIPTETVDLLPGLYPEGTLLNVWNNVITKEEAENSRTLTWEEMVLNEYVYDLSNGHAGLNSTFAGDVVVPATISDFVIDALSGRCEDITFSFSQNLESVYFELTAPKALFLYSDARITFDHQNAPVYLGKNVNLINATVVNCGWDKIVLHPENKYLTYKNNCLYSKDLQTLFAVSSDANGNVIVNENVKTIKNGTFGSGMRHITIPTGVVNIEPYAFNGFGCQTDVESMSLPVHALDMIDLNYILISRLEIVDGDKIEDGQFENDLSLKHVIIKNINEIGPAAFKRCYNLETVTIEGNVRIIGDDVFYDCDHLTSITISDSVTSIGDDAFRDCTRLTSVTIPDSVTSIGNSVFQECDNLESVVIGDSVTSIGEWAFAYCYNLTSVVIPDSVTSICWNAFSYCERLTSITIPDSVTSIDGYAFYGCSSLTIYCKAESQPNGWSDNWAVRDDSPDYVNYHRVEWGYTGN